MNYRHGFHAGNFADVFKHAIFARVLAHLTEKQKPFRVIDTHAGRGRYDLEKEAARTGEYRAGIEKLLAAPPQGAAGDLLTGYLDCVRELNTGAELRFYPGSPALAASLIGPNAATFCELHPDEFAALAKWAAAFPNARALQTDGWQALKSLLPPPERRAVVLIDPPFEDADEFRRLADGMAEAARRFATGIYLLWYPVKNRHEAHAATRRIARVAGKPALRLEFAIASPKADGALAACGLLAINPPWKLEEESRVLLPALLRALGAENRGAVGIERLD